MNDSSCLSRTCITCDTTYPLEDKHFALDSRPGQGGFASACRAYAAAKATLAPRRRRENPNEYEILGDHVSIVLPRRDGTVEYALFSDTKLPLWLSRPDLHWNVIEYKNGDKYCIARDRRDRSIKNGKPVYLHALLFGTIGTDQIANHLDWDGLNCRDSNIIVGTQSDNMKHRLLNLRPRKNNTSGVRCVQILESGKHHRKTSRYRVMVARKYHGVFDTVSEAAAAAKEAILAHNFSLIEKIVAAEMMVAA